MSRVHLLALEQNIAGVLLDRYIEQIKPIRDTELVLPFKTVDPEVFEEEILLTPPELIKPPYEEEPEIVYFEEEEETDFEPELVIESELDTLNKQATYEGPEQVQEEPKPTTPQVIKELEPVDIGSAVIQPEPKQKQATEPKKVKPKHKPAGKRKELKTAPTDLVDYVIANPNSTEKDLRKYYSPAQIRRALRLGKVTMHRGIFIA